ncbi:acetyl-CoA synthetase-like protein [Tilletiaria anomala UBC 951]|uniref:Acetyl-CoA synthetase-like protein n=1 Tax=Tilletiaria anomala (strain ATCC 24038 / CBS 436.72 / UBC 951) TaxID=1037660 RepID=A0A066VH90_TILAU|nr:acetyl-CoA synthetase-like protein [Tilletiaria anomala UBC 951]KDN37925.1 acetyl-CoA synthetase-like protein [Tilletiaria anomala UBC 951]
MVTRISDSEWHGEDIPYVKQGNLTSLLFSSPFSHLPNTDPDRFPDWTFDGHEIPPHCLFLVHDGTHASVTHERAYHDILRVARSFHELIGKQPAPFPATHRGTKRTAVWSPETTVLLHIPNCLAFPILLLGATAAKCTVSPISTHLQVPEIAYLLAYARPHVIITTKGASEGEGRIRAALQSIIDRPEPVGEVTAEEGQRWAIELAHTWDRSAKQSTLQRGETLPFAQQRVWLVDLARTVDYYGTNTNAAGIPAATLDKRDWTNLLRPIGPTHRLPFQIEVMQQDELEARAAVLLWSSGTTGKSKGVLLSHQALMAEVYSQWSAKLSTGVYRGAYGGGERWVALAPWCHIYGLATFLLSAIATGATIILPPTPEFHLETYCRLLEKYRVTFAHIAPGVVVALRNSPLLDQDSSKNGRAIDFSSVKGFGTGGAPIPSRICLDVCERSGGKYVHMGYGSTETGGAAYTVCPSIPAEQQTGSSPGSSRHAALASMFNWGSTGVPLANKMIRICPAEGATSDSVQARYEEYRLAADKVREAGGRAPSSYCAPGEIQIKGPVLLLGYLSGVSSSIGSAIDAKLTRGAFTADGWYKTGDEGVFDAHGNLWITGRIKELIKTKGGFQCSPPEVEACFAQHPAVADVACVGIYDPQDAAEFPLLYVVPKDVSLLPQEGAAAEDAEAEAKRVELVRDLAHFCVDRLTFYKWPKAYSFIPVIIKNPGGKILRKDLQALQTKRYVAPRHRQRTSTSSLGTSAKL